MQISLTELFERQDQTVPQSQNSGQKIPSFKKLTVSQEISGIGDTDRAMSHTLQVPENRAQHGNMDDASSEEDEPAEHGDVPSLIESFASRDSRQRATKADSAPAASNWMQTSSKDKQKLIRKLGRERPHSHEPDRFDDAQRLPEPGSTLSGIVRPVEDFNRRIAEQQPESAETSATVEGLSQEEPREILLTENKSQTEYPSGAVQNAFDRMRPRRSHPEVASITIGSKTTTSILAPSSSDKRRRLDLRPTTPFEPICLADDTARQKFSGSVRAFAAPGSELPKSVANLHSKPRVSRLYSSSASENEDKTQVGDQSLGPSSPSEDNDESPAESTGFPAGESLAMSPMDTESDGDYLDDEEKKAREEATVAKLIKQAEEGAAIPSQDNIRRADQILKGRGPKDSTSQLIQMIAESVGRVDERLQTLKTALQASANCGFSPNLTALTEDTSAEEGLSLAVSKADFADMHIVGQFNLGFILAVRAPSSSSPNPDLFIIDQHASDEKYNFERLQANTIVQNQRLVRPQKLNLTAIEEEIVLDNADALLKNGFRVEIDTSGDEEVGRRCQLMSLPMSRETTFDATDLEELIGLLAESPSSSSSGKVPRPTKVRRMFAMRACRSSVMIGKTLTLKQMGALVRKMGEIDKPWNCPHGRPTMRHVGGLQEWEGWKEGGGLAGLVTVGDDVDWRTWIESMRQQQEMEQDESDDREDEQVENESR